MNDSDTQLERPQYTKKVCFNPRKQDIVKYLVADDVQSYTKINKDMLKTRADNMAADAKTSTY